MRIIQRMIKLKAYCIHWLMAAMLLIILISCERDRDDVIFSDEGIMTLADYIKGNEETFSHFWKIIETGELVHTLSSYNPHGDRYTLFLPTDDAFERFIRNSMIFQSFDELLADVDYVRELGRFHLVNKQFRSTEFPYGSFPDTTVSGEYLTMGYESSLDTTIYKVNNNAPIIETNIELVNG